MFVPAHFPVVLGKVYIFMKFKLRIKLQYRIKKANNLLNSVLTVIKAVNCDSWALFATEAICTCMSNSKIILAAINDDGCHKIVEIGKICFRKGK